MLSYFDCAEVNSPQDSAAFSDLAVCAGDVAGELPGGAGSLAPPGGGGSKPKPPLAPPLLSFDFDVPSAPSFFYTEYSVSSK